MSPQTIEYYDARANPLIVLDDLAEGAVLDIEVLIDLSFRETCDALA